MNERIGNYQVIRTLGKGGMGEVLLVYDPLCGREVALKRVREDLINKGILHARFLREAKLTSQLAHPSIIPIYTIHFEGGTLYYTMPYVEGETLKAILYNTLKAGRSGKTQDILRGSISHLIPVFLKVCQAVAFSHSKGVIHRDLKPENIMVGKYGEVVILDWGVAREVGSAPLSSAEELLPEDNAYTSAGRIVGTLNYLPPEQAYQKTVTKQGDIYALGVILYQILTLKPPFQRGSLKQFRTRVKEEQVLDPVEVAPPERDVPDVLASVAQRCLAKNPKERYGSVEEIILELEDYMEGRSSWFLEGALDTSRPEDWEFQEHVLITEQMAIRGRSAFSEWVTMMVSKAAFSRHVKLEATFRLQKGNAGLGFLLSIPETAKRNRLNEGFCLWLGTGKKRGSRLLRSGIEVVSAPHLYLRTNKTYRLVIEQKGSAIHLSLDGVEQLSYLSALPLFGAHVGLLARDGLFEMQSLKIYSGSHTLEVSCLDVPDALLAHHHLESAFAEYRRLATSFSGHKEGREARFRAGMVLLEQAKEAKTKREAQKYYDRAFDEMDHLRQGPAAPLSYIGKALIYKAMGDYPDEVRCFEMVVRRYYKHPLLPLIKEHMMHRMHEAAQSSRFVVYSLILLSLRHLPDFLEHPANAHLLLTLQQHGERLPFLLREQGSSKISLAITLSFWLARPWELVDILSTLYEAKDPNQAQEASDALFCLAELGCKKEASQSLKHFQDIFPAETELQSSLEIAIKARTNSLSADMEKAATRLTKAPASARPYWIRTLFYLFEFALREGLAASVEVICEKLPSNVLPANRQKEKDIFWIWALLQQQKWKEAGERLNRYPLEEINQEESLLHFLYACWLRAIEGREIAKIHLFGILESFIPQSNFLAHHYFLGKLGPDSVWYKEAFLWERRQLFQQLSLYYICANDLEKAEKYKQKTKRCVAK